MKIDASNKDVYWQGFRDGSKLLNGIIQTFSYMGYSEKEIAELITKDQEEKFKAKTERYVDWSKDLQITTHHGTFKVINLGIGWKGKRIVQIEEGSARFPSHDGTLPNVFVPDENGYVVQFDTWIENKSPATKVGFLTDKYSNGLIIEINGKIIYEFKPNL